MYIAHNAHTTVLRPTYHIWTQHRIKVVLADLREAKAAASLEPAEIAFGGPFIARGYLGRSGLGTLWRTSLGNIRFFLGMVAI